MDVSIIFVNWNSADYLRECLASIYANTRKVSFEIIVVDNASTEPGLESVGREYPQASIIASKTNLGFAGANNLGFEHSSGDYLLFLNPDTKLLGPSIEILVERMKAMPDGGVLGCKLLNSDMSVQITSIQKFPTILNQVVDAEYLMLRWPGLSLWSLAPLFQESTAPVSVDAISGACMLLRREVFAKVGRFTEEYFMYGEDLDLNYKVKRAGFNNYYVGETSVIHYGGRSSARQKISQWATIMRANAMLRLFRRTRGAAYSTAYRIAMAGVAMGRLVLLGLAFLLGNRVVDRGTVRVAASKWKAVLDWSLGRQDLALQNR